MATSLIVNGLQERNQSQSLETLTVGIEMNFTAKKSGMDNSILSYQARMGNQGCSITRSIRYKFRGQMGKKRIEIQLGLGFPFRTRTLFCMIMYSGTQNTNLRGNMKNQFEVKFLIKV